MLDQMVGLVQWEDTLQEHNCTAHMVNHLVPSLPNTLHKHFLLHKVNTAHNTVPTTTPSHLQPFPTTPTATIVHPCSTPIHKTHRGNDLSKSHIPLYYPHHFLDSHIHEQTTLAYGERRLKMI